MPAVIFHRRAFDVRDYNIKTIKYRLVQPIVNGKQTEKQTNVKHLQCGDSNKSGNLLDQTKANTKIRA